MRDKEVEIKMIRYVEGNTEGTALGMVERGTQGCPCEKTLDFLSLKISKAALRVEVVYLGTSFPWDTGNTLSQMPCLSDAPLWVIQRRHDLDACHGLSSCPEV